MDENQIDISNNQFLLNFKGKDILITLIPKAVEDEATFEFELKSEDPLSEDEVNEIQSALEDFLHKVLEDALAELEKKKGEDLIDEEMEV